MVAIPFKPLHHGPRLATRAIQDPIVANYTPSQLVVEAWAEGFNFGGLIVLVLFVLCNYRRGVILHKLILLELVLALGHCIFIFCEDPTFGWVISATATLLYLSYGLHNVVSWLKIRPFLPQWGGRFFIISLAVVQPYWVLEMYANFQYFNMLGGTIFKISRYFEPLARDPWWIFTTIKLVLVINKNYEYTVMKLIHTSPRFGIMLLCMFASVVFLATDLAATGVISTQSGINPFWRLALVFKCASDTIFLDDFKSVLDHISESALRRATQVYASGSANRRSNTRPPQGSESRPPMTQGSVVTISADNNRGVDGGRHAPGKKGWSVTRLTSHRGRDSAEQRILGNEGSVEGQPRIMTETTITVSKQTGPSIHSTTPSMDEGDNIVPIQEGPLSAPSSYSWVDGGATRGSTVLPSQDDLEKGIPMKAWREKKVEFK